MGEDNVRCPQCVAEGRTSTVEVLGTTLTAMAQSRYYDEDGRPHAHDPNWYESTCRCSNGHRFACIVRLPCWCGWPHPPQD